MPLSAHTTLLIAAVAGSVGGVLLLSLLLCCLLRRPEKPAPLPPKQELARYREQQTIHVASRPATWYDSSYLSAPSGTPRGSNLSLLPPDSRGGSPFRRQSSLNTTESPSEDISHLSGTVPMVPAFQLPQFDTSRTSLSTAETDPASWSPHPASAADSPFPPARQSRSASSSSGPSRPRPLSMGSNSNSAMSRHSRHNIRGTPHGPLSQVEIIMPAPLAFNDRTSIHDNSSRLSVVDQWAPAAVRSEGNHPIPRPQRRSFSSSELHRPVSQSSLAQPPQPRARTVSSSPSASPQRAAHPPVVYKNRDYSNSPSPLSTPPVPQIPQQWRPDPLTGIVGDTGRGRSRDLAPGAVASHELPPLPGGHRLQKRSRSTGQ
ncbi:hypothetical protein DFH06DRAFT_489569 [Mycena polygramma]|nr:hypothetical protein DFH06DRAFT_489569 [Mycena polygramma]